MVTKNMKYLIRNVLFSPPVLFLGNVGVFNTSSENSYINNYDCVCCCVLLWPLCGALSRELKDYQEEGGGLGGEI